MNKYHAIKTTVDGITFHSRAESNRYAELKLLERAGEIKKLKLQPKYELQKAFDDDDGNHHKAISYIADFEYLDKKHGWSLVVEDVKGKKTEVYRLKKKLFLYRYPYRFLET